MVNGTFFGFFVLRRPPDCHHPARIPHRCHFGECPPCRLQCLKQLQGCTHTCPIMCHSAVKVKIKDNVCILLYCDVSVVSVIDQDFKSR